VFTPELARTLRSRAVGEAGTGVAKRARSEKNGEPIATSTKRSRPSERIRAAADLFAANSPQFSSKFTLS
jgi:hypothetical protein